MQSHFPNPIDPGRILRETPIVHVDYRAEVASTNDLAVAATQDGEFYLPLLATADRQTDGRGRGGNLWWSAPGSLVFSILLDPLRYGLAPAKPFPLPIMIAVALAETLKQWVPDDAVGVKWPNDLWLRKRKVSGILIESSAEPPGGYVIGVGINVNNRIADAPSDIHTLATSMADEGWPVDRNDVLVVFLQRLFALLDAFPSQWPRTIETYRRCCALTGQSVELDAGSTRVVGTCHGIDEEGLLVIQSAHGRQSYAAGTVRRTAT